MEPITSIFSANFLCQLLWETLRSTLATLWCHRATFVLRRSSHTDSIDRSLVESLSLGSFCWSSNSPLHLADLSSQHSSTSRTSWRRTTPIRRSWTRTRGSSLRSSLFSKVIWHNSKKSKTLLLLLKFLKTRSSFFFIEHRRSIRPTLKVVSNF